MATDRSERPYDIVVLGATGFTGGLTARYLARHMPAGGRWAVAGRNPDRLRELAAELSGLAGADANAGAVREPAPVGTIVADTSDAASLRDMAQATRVVATTVGPYVQYGDGVVAACAEAGTDYLDLTGEPEFVDRSYLAADGPARASGARLVHCCGFDSIPADLGVYYTVSQLPGGVPLTVEGHVRVGGRPSSGTIHSAIGIAGRLPQGAAAARRRKAVEGPVPGGRRIRTSGGDPRRPLKRFDGRWAVALPLIDTSVVAHSARLVERYGPDFTYHHYGVADHVASLVGLGLAAVPVILAAQVPPTRDLLLRRFPAGAGPSEEQRARAFFEVTFVGDGGGRRVVTRVSGGDPGYDETAKMLSESAMGLAFDDGLPARAGQVTPAAAMGDRLIERLVAAGITFEVLERA